MLFVLSILAAFGVAVCNGISAVLQKTGADASPRADSLHPGLLWGLFHNTPYIIGMVVDLGAWLLTMVAVHSLPLFLVEPITGLSVLVTLLVEWLFYKKKLHPWTLIAMVAILAGLFIIASQATIQTARIPSGATYWVIIAATPATLIVLGAWFVRQKASYATTALAALAGIAFGGTAIAGRMLNITTPYWHALMSYPFASLVVYGALGLLFFTIALQRHHASTVSASTIAFETIVPTVIGLSFLGDAPRNGSYILIILGGLIALGGILAVILVEHPDEELAKISSDSLSK